MSIVGELRAESYDQGRRGFPGLAALCSRAADELERVYKMVDTDPGIALHATTTGNVEMTVKPENGAGAVYAFTPENARKFAAEMIGKSNQAACPGDVVWGVYQNPGRVDVAPVDHRHSMNGSCWCGVKVERGEDSLPIVIHYARAHVWKEGEQGKHTCRRCLELQTPANADSFCKGPHNGE